MFSEKDKKEIEKEIKEQTFTDEEPEVDLYENAKIKSGLIGSFSNKFKNLQVKYKKDKRKTLVALGAIIAMFSVLCGSSYAYLTYVSKTANNVTINAGTLAMVIQNEENAIILQNAVPVKDSVGLDSDKEYSFKVRNTGTIPASYTITLNNTCTTGSGVDLCVPDEYVKVGIKIGNGSYKVVERSEKSKYIIETGSLDAGAVQNYKMKIWLAHNTPNTYNSAISGDVYYKGKLGLTYEQGKEYIPEPGATVLYTDGTLIINEPSSQRQANIQTHGAVSQEYVEMKSEGTDVQKYIFTSASQQPWYNDRSSITKVEIGQQLRPTSTAYWFYGLTNVTTGNLANLDTRNVTTMRYMFYQTGYSSAVTSFVLTGLNNWNTSQVTNMQHIFSQVGYYATTWNIGNLSNWDTSKVENMGSMFSSAGYSSTTFDIGDLSGWDTSSATNMNRMFSSAGFRATTWNIGKLSNWDISEVENMGYMFSSAGRNATAFNLDLSNWDVSQVTDMSFMFNTAGYNATTFNIGDLSGWDTSSATNMNSMFNGAGYNATTWNSIGTFKVYATTINNFFNGSPKAKATVSIYSNPSSYTTAFANAATDSSALITVNYSSATTNIDNIVATKSSNSNVVKGVQLD